MADGMAKAGAEKRADVLQVMEEASGKRSRDGGVREREGDVLKPEDNHPIPGLTKEPYSR